MSAVTVIGLGSMGTTLARLLLRAGHQVTVWNRTASKATGLVAEGARLAPDAAAAIAASPVVVTIVYDYKASNEILQTKEASRALGGRTLVQLTTGSPQESRDSERWARELGARYLDGAIQAAPDQMGGADTPILVSGPLQTYREHEPLLRLLAGNLVYLGEDAGAASAMDLATLSYVYGALIGFFHGARVTEVEGLSVEQYGGIVKEIAPTFGAFFQHEAAVIRSGDYRITQSPLSISVEATARLLQTARASRINDEFPAFAASLLSRASKAGYGGEEIAAVMKVLRE